MSQKKIPFYRSLWILTPVALMVFVIIISGALFRIMGDMIVADEKASPADAVVVLNTGIEYYPRLIQAADLYRQGLAVNVVINGDRKTDTLRDLERKGFKTCCPWYADSVSILAILGVPEDKIIRISNQDAYDTVSEADVVGRELIKRKWTSVIITTSKYHTRRAKFIWQKMYKKRITIFMVSAKTDPYDPDNWWKDGRQIRWVLAEYGAWLYYWWKEITEL
ncbi:YdcF family protein [Thermodesulfobacteriota bacterium]